MQRCDVCAWSVLVAATNCVINSGTSSDGDVVEHSLDTASFVASKIDVSFSVLANCVAASTCPGTQELVELDVEATIPASGSEICRLEFVDDTVGLGPDRPPRTNRVVVSSAVSILPEPGFLEIELTADDPDPPAPIVFPPEDEITVEVVLDPMNLRRHYKVIPPLEDFLSVHVTQESPEVGDTSFLYLRWGAPWTDREFDVATAIVNKSDPVLTVPTTGRTECPYVTIVSYVINSLPNDVDVRFSTGSLAISESSTRSGSKGGDNRLHTRVTGAGFRAGRVSHSNRRQTKPIFRRLRKSFCHMVLRTSS